MNSLNNVFWIVYAIEKTTPSIHNDLKIISNIQTDRLTDRPTHFRKREGEVKTKHFMGMVVALTCCFCLVCFKNNFSNTGVTISREYKKLSPCGRPFTRYDGQKLLQYSCKLSCAQSSPCLNYLGTCYSHGILLFLAHLVSLVGNRWLNMIFLPC